ncbi:MAG: ribosome-associated translation inhibitor RaiA [Bacteroidota bacterium]
MEVTIQAIHATVTEHEKAYLRKKMDKLERFHDQILRAEAIFKDQAASGPKSKALDVKVAVPGNTLLAKGMGSTFQEATDLMIEKLKVQLKKHKQTHG